MSTHKPLYNESVKLKTEYKFHFLCVVTFKGIKTEFDFTGYFF